MFIKAMRRLIFLLLTACILLSGCKNKPIFKSISALNPSNLGVDDQYTISGGDTLFSYYEEPLESFYGVCKYYEELGWSLYNSNCLNNNQFATYTNENNLIHIYWIECESELNVVTSSTGGYSLPPNDPAVKSGSTESSVTQLQSSEINGMGYVVQLADRSFLIIDGGYASCVDELWSTLVDLNGGEENIIIRAWLLTHAHDDHYSCFSSFAAKYATRVTLETLMISPLSDDDASNLPYLNGDVKKDLANFLGAKILYVHTGMVFNYCNIKFEILFTGEELWISDPTRDEGLADLLNFNNSSGISRCGTHDHRAIFLADSSEEVALRLSLYYGKYLKSEMCQISHHGVEDFPLIAYRFINASTYWCPCNRMLFEIDGRDLDVRNAFIASKYTKEIILHDDARITRLLQANDKMVE